MQIKNNSFLFERNVWRHNFFLSHGRYWDPYYYRRQRPQADDDKMNFIESVCDANEITCHPPGPFLFLNKDKDFLFSGRSSPLYSEMVIPIKELKKRDGSW